MEFDGIRSYMKRILFFLKYEINNEHCASSNLIENGNFNAKKQKKKVKSEQKNIKWNTIFGQISNISTRAIKSIQLIWNDRARHNNAGNTHFTYKLIA